MATAVAMPSPAAVPTGPDASDNLELAILDLPTVEALFVTPRSIAGPIPGLSDPRPDAYSKLGFLAPVEDLAILGRIHVIPRIADLGAVITDQKISVEIWNAALTRAKTLQEITLDGPAGIAVQDLLALPAHWPASDSKVYEVTVYAEGDPRIDNLVTWVFVGVDPDGTNIHILGYRLTISPFEPDGAGANADGASAVERYGYLTDLLEAQDGTEQRVQLREVPVGSISMRLTLTDLEDVQLAQALLYGNQPRTWGVPRWQFRTLLTAGVVPDDLEIPCDTSYRPFEAGAIALLWDDARHWEAVTIAEVQADRLVANLGIRGTWTAGKTQVIPLVLGRLTDEEIHVLEALMVGSETLTFSIDGFKP